MKEALHRMLSRACKLIKEPAPGGDQLHTIKTGYMFRAIQSVTSRYSSCSYFIKQHL